LQSRDCKIYQKVLFFIWLIAEKVLPLHAKNFIFITIMT